VQKGHGICGECVVSFDRVYLLVHPGGAAIKVGVASGNGRTRRHFGSGYRLVAQWAGLTHSQAATAERQVITFWRLLGWPQIEAAPKDGRTETAASTHLTETLAHLTDLLREPTHRGVATAQFT